MSRPVPRTVIRRAIGGAVKSAATKVAVTAASAAYGGVKAAAGAIKRPDERRSAPTPSLGARSTVKPSAPTPSFGARSSIGRTAASQPTFANRTRPALKSPTVTFGSRSSSFKTPTFNISSPIRKSNINFGPAASKNKRSGLF